jgi:LacI family transcriptional regulator
MQRRPTMRDVAIAAGVSVKTVSRVVNNEDAVRPEVALRVRHAIDALGYEPDHRAQNLRRGGRRTSTIGFVLVDVANPFFSAIYRGLEDVAWDAGYVVLAGSSDGATDRGQAILRTLISRRVDGLVVVPSGEDHVVIAAEMARGTPVVLLDLEAGDLSDVDVVRSDHRGGARVAIEHLLRHDHRDIAFLGDDDTIFSAAQRKRGFLDAMGAAGLTARDEWMIVGPAGPARASAAVHSLMAVPGGRPTALFSAQNFITLGAVQALHDLALQHEIALVGFDDVDLAAAVDPALTVIPQQPTELGRMAGELLLERLGGHAGPARRRIVESQLITRGSGEIRPRA